MVRVVGGGDVDAAGTPANESPLDGYLNKISINLLKKTRRLDVSWRHVVIENCFLSCVSVFPFVEVVVGDVVDVGFKVVNIESLACAWWSMNVNNFRSEILVDLA